MTKDVELNSNPITAPIVQANFSSRDLSSDHGADCGSSVNAHSAIRSASFALTSSVTGLGTTFLTLTQFVALDSAAAVYKPSLGLQNDRV